MKTTNNELASLHKLIGFSDSERVNYNQVTLKASYIDTILGRMLAISDDKNLHFLGFTDAPFLHNKINKLKIINKLSIIPESSNPIENIKEELNLYFSGKLKSFRTCVKLIGTDFQKKSWNILLNIPYGKTISYKKQAKTINNNKAFRAVGLANSANQLAIIVPCHRVIKDNGEIGGYAYGEKRKKWLINHEAII